MDLIHTASASRYFIYLLLVAGSSLGIYWFTQYQYSEWIIFSAFLFAQFELGDKPLHRAIAISLTGFCVAAMIFVLSFIAPTIFAMVCLLIITAISTYIGIKKNQLYFVLFVGVILLLTVFIAPASQVVYVQKAEWIFCGALLASFYQWVFFSPQNQRMIFWLRTALQQLEEMSDLIFTQLLQPDYKNNMYLQERRLHLQKNRYLEAICQVRVLRRQSKQPEIDSLIQDCEALFDILNTLALLRWDVSDYTIFSLCSYELSSIAKAIQYNIKNIQKKIAGKKPKQERADLAEAVGAFEDVYQNVLRVTAREPLRFLLFLINLKNLQTIMQLMHSHVEKEHV